MLTTLLSLLLANQFLTGGILLGILAIFWQNFIKALGVIKRFLYSYVFYTFTVNDDSHEAYWCVKRWMINNNFTKICKYLDLIHENGEIKSSCGVGTFLSWYKNRPILFSKRRSKVDDAIYSFKEEISITVFSWNKKLINSILKEINNSKKSNPDTIKSFLPEKYNGWSKCKIIGKKQIDHVIGNDEQINEIINDAIKFTKSDKRYKDLNINYQRGYLFYGPPGNGKTSTIKLIASILDRDIYTLKLANLDGSSDFDKCYGSIPDNSIIVFEDIDCLFQERKSESECQVSFDSILNALDGINSGLGHIIILTTNHKDKLDKALLRAGRVDKQYHFDKPSRDSTYKFIKRFAPNATSEKLSPYIEKTLSLDYSFADLQVFCLEHQEELSKL